MRRYVIPFFFVLCTGLLYAQVPTPVSIVTDSLKTAYTQIEQTAQMIAQVQKATSMLENQIKTLEALGQGDWDGLVKAFNYQNQALGEFSAFLDDDFGLLEDLDEFNKLLESDDFKALQTDTSIMSDIFDSSNNAMQSLNRMVQGAQIRMQQSQNINEVISNTSSFTAQLQATNQQLGLLNSAMADTLLSIIALDKAVVTQQMADQAERELARKEAEHIIYSGEFGCTEEMETDEMIDMLTTPAIGNF